MKKLEKIVGKTIPLAMDNIDTDLIIPAQYLTNTNKTGYGPHLFQRLKEKDSHFIFNQPAFKDSNILISKKSFGCGSSREHAVWALLEAGVEAVIAVSFADIFANNSHKNGLVLITLPETTIQSMLSLANNADYYLSIDIQKMIITSSMHPDIGFDLDPFSQYCFMNGLDDLDYLLAHQQTILNFKESNLRYRYKWRNESDGDFKPK